MYKKCRKKQKNHPSVIAYNAYKNLFNKIKRKAKISFTQTQLNLYKNNIRKSWQIVNNLLGKRTDKSSCVKLLTINDNQISDPKDIADHFAHFFKNVGKNQATSISAINKSPHDYLRNSNLNMSMFMKPTDETEIANIIQSFISKTSSGFDNISNKLLKNILPGVITPLTILINQSIKEGIFPNLLKQAKVIPLYKNKDKDNPNNYRPISLLSSVSKVFEKVIHKRIYKFLEQTKIFNPLQFGFRSNHSTIDAVTKLINDIYLGFVNKEYTLAVFCDLSKAFDTLDHNVLLYKLNKIGIRGQVLSLIKSYLTNRSIFVQNGKECSDFHTCPEFGVPQGSILGPLLFNIYVNDLHLSINNTKHLLYADDTTIYLVGTKIKSMFSQMNEVLNNLSIWFKANKLSLNVGKTKFMLFTGKRNLKTNYALNIDGILIEKVDHFKFLGIHLDNELRWNVHTHHIEKKIAGGLYALNSLKHMLPTCNLRSLYFALINSHLSYGCQLWGNTFDKHLHKLKVQQKKAIRIVCHALYNSPATPLFSQVQILKFEDLYKLQLNQFMFKLYHQTITAPLANIIKHNQDTHEHNTRKKEDFIIPMYKHNLVYRSFLSTGPRLWSTIPVSFKTLKYKPFCRNLKKHYLENYL